jgi:Resolvase, N terminal domain
VSGVAAKRPVRDEALAQLQAGDTLTIWKLDRLGRSVVELLEIVKDLEQRRIKFKVLTQQIDTSTPMGRMFLILLAGFAEMERDLILERTAAGKRIRAERGLHPGGSPLYGFAADHETVIEHEAQLLREAAERLLDQHEPMSRIIDDWNERGLRPRGAPRWQVTPLRRTLVNPRVIPIIGQAAHRDLARLFDNTKRQRLGRPAEHLLSGILACPCGQPLYAATKGGQPPQRVYICKKASGSGGRFAGCGRTAVSEARANDWAREAFIASIVSPGFAQALDRRQAELLAGEVTVQELDEWRAEMADIETVLPTRFGTPDLQRRHDELRRMVDEATARLMAQPEIQAMLDLPRSEDALRARWDAWSIAQRREWLHRLVERIDVKPATARSRHSDVEARMEPKWRI